MDHPEVQKVQIDRTGPRVKVHKLLGWDVLSLRIDFKDIHPDKFWRYADGDAMLWIGFEGGWRSLAGANESDLKAMLPDGFEACGLELRNPTFGLIDVKRPPHQDAASAMTGTRDGGRWLMQLANGGGIQWRTHDFLRHAEKEPVVAQLFPEAGVVVFLPKEILVTDCGYNHETIHVSKRAVLYGHFKLWDTMAAVARKCKKKWQKAKERNPKGLTELPYEPARFKKNHTGRPREEKQIGGFYGGARRGQLVRDGLQPAGPTGVRYADKSLITVLTNKQLRGFIHGFQDSDPFVSPGVKPKLSPG